MVGNGRRIWLLLSRALRLRCPLCGRSPLFVSLGSVRSLEDWFAPLEGCAPCGYAYEREPGYFLMAIWAVNYGIVGLLFLGIVLPLAFIYDLGTLQALWLVLPMPLVSFGFARHAKALFMAFDHFLDPPAPFRSEEDR